MQWLSVFRAEDARVLSRQQLLTHGGTATSIAEAVKAGELIRARRGNYLLPKESLTLQRAVRVGGRLACISTLDDAGVFAFAPTIPHVHVAPNAARLRSSSDRWTPLATTSGDDVVIHWRPLLKPAEARPHSVSISDALVQSLWCQRPEHSLASIENALHRRLLRARALDAIFDAGPKSLLAYRPLVDPKAESGQETVLRLLVRELGHPVESQVTIPGIGRVDFVVDDRLILEADSRQAHDGWELHVRDRERDLRAAAIGLMSLRPAYGMTMYRPELVKRAIDGLLA